MQPEETATLHKARGGWVAIPNSTIADRRISIEARGLLAFMLSCSEGWRFSSAHLAEVCCVGRDKLQRMMGELRDHGYLALVPDHGERGRIVGFRWVVDQAPDRLPEKPADGESVGRKNRLHKNTNSKNTESQESAARSEPSLFDADSLEEQNGELKNPPQKAPTPPDAFTRFWAAYPKCSRKTDRPECLRLFTAIVAGKQKGIPKTDAELIVTAAARYQAQNPDPQYIPAPARWLRGARWESVEAPSRESDASEPSEVAIYEAKRAQRYLEQNEPRPDRKTGQLHRADRERLGAIARVRAWWLHGVDPVVKVGPDWWTGVDFLPHIAMLMAYDMRKPPEGARAA